MLTDWSAVIEGTGMIEGVGVRARAFVEALP